MRTARAVPTPWLCRKTMISRTIFCSAQALAMRSARIGPMPDTSRRRLGLGLDDVEHLLAECLDQLPGVDRADAADHAGGEILLDAVGRGGGRAAQKAGLELLAMGAVVDPFARGGDPLAGGDRGGMPDGGHQLAVSPRLDAQNAEAVLGIVEGDALDETRQHLLCR